MEDVYLCPFTMSVTLFSLLPSLPHTQAPQSVFVSPKRKEEVPLPLIEEGALIGNELQQLRDNRVYSGVSVSIGFYQINWFFRLKLNAPSGRHNGWNRNQSSQAWFCSQKLQDCLCCCNTRYNQAQTIYFVFRC